MRKMKIWNDKKSNAVDNISDERIKMIVEETIGNSDPFWKQPVLMLVQKIIALPDDAESSIIELLGSSQLSSKQLFDLTLCVNEVCKKINILLDFDKEDVKIDELLYSLPFIKRTISNGKTLLKRSELANKFYGYHSINNIISKEDTQDYLNDINAYLSNFEYKSDNNFVISGRKQFIYDEIMDILRGNQSVEQPLYFILGSLEEFISNSNSISFSEPNFMDIKSKNDKYIKSGYVCLEEKIYIDKIIKEIEKYISNN